MVLKLQSEDKFKAVTVPANNNNGATLSDKNLKPEAKKTTREQKKIYDKNNKLVEEQVFTYGGPAVNSFYALPEDKIFSTGETASKIELTKFYDKGKTIFTQDSSGINLKFFDNQGKALRTDVITFGGSNKSEPLIYGQSTIDYKNNTKYSINNVDSDPDPNIYKIDKKFNTLDGENIAYNYQSDTNKGTSNFNLAIGNFKVNREYKKINESDAVSKVNSQEYNIHFDGDKITVTHNNKKTLIDLNKKIAGNNQELKALAKTLPGDVLLQFNRQIELVTPVKIGGEFFNTTDKMTCSNHVFTLLHETGHGVANDPGQDSTATMGLSKDKELRRIFTQEVANFKNIMPSKLQGLEEYFIDYKAGDEKRFNSKLDEIIAESYEIVQSGGLSTMGTQNYEDKDVFNRQHLLMQFFPKTMAYVGTKTLEYEQTIDLNHPRTNKEKSDQEKDFFDKYDKILEKAEQQNLETEELLKTIKEKDKN